MRMQCIYILKFGKILVKLSVLGGPVPIPAPMRVKFGMKEWTYCPLLLAKFHPISVMCCPCRVKTPKLPSK